MAPDLIASRLPLWRAGSLRTGPRPRQGSVAASRERFLQRESVDSGQVRETILASWHRSRVHQVVADHVEQPYQEDLDVDSPITRAALPVLESLRQQLGRQPMSIVLTDPSGLVLTRLTGDDALARHLDRVNLAPGFRYAENDVGTNGIGTALEVGGPARVFGHEHYAEYLEELSCAAVPVRHPLTGRTVCAVDLTCWSKDAGPLLVTLAKSMAAQIGQALVDDATVGQRHLLEEYLRTCRRHSGIVFAVGRELELVNSKARALLDPLDQAALVLNARDALTDGRLRSGAVDLPSGVRARVYGVPVGEGADDGGVVVHVKLLAAEDDAHRSSAPPGPPVTYAGVVGSSPLWRHACEQVDTAYRTGEWFAVAGEPGVGKLTLLRGVVAHAPGAHTLAVVDLGTPQSATAQRRELRAALGAGTVVLRHLDRLDPRRAGSVLTALREAAGGPQVVATMADAPVHPALGELLALFPSTVDLPPLRHRLDDLDHLVPHLLDRLGTAQRLSCSPEVMGVLARAVWPGNVEQLVRVLRHVVARRRTGVVRVEDLPPEMSAVSRRRLSQLESLERDAIVLALAEAHGDKSAAATALGVSRATVYRKIRDYGIVEA